MSVLMLYNSALVHSVGSIQSQTSIELPTLLQILHILLKAKVLKVTDEPVSGHSALSADALTTPAISLLAEDSSDLQLTTETNLALYTTYKKYVSSVQLYFILSHQHII
ncbi:unnamed protein product [Dicrocoelium dendriticum]|nr:unnamed protein product [Dicrocoelium dendriticum]